MVGTEVKRRERAGVRVRNSEEGGLPAQCLGPVRDARQSQRDRLLCVHQRPEQTMARPCCGRRQSPGERALLPVTQLPRPP